MLRINVRNLLCFLLLLPIFRISSIMGSPLMWTFFNLYTYLAIVLLLVAYVQTRRLPSVYTLLFGLFLTSLSISNYLNGLNALSVFSDYNSFILLLLIVDFYRFELPILIRNLYAYFEFLIYFNFLTLVLFPSGLFSRYTDAYGYTQEWLFGAKNDFIRYFLPAITIIFLYRRLSEKVLRTNLFTLVILLSLFIQASATGIVGVVLYLLLINLSILKPLLSTTRSTVMIWGSFFLVVIFRSYAFLEPIIVGLLGKTLNFSNRTPIWDNALWYIQERLLQGYGILDLQTMVSMLGFFPNGFIWKGATHAHNHFLQLLLQGGVPALLSFGILMYVSMFRSRYFVYSKLITAASLTLGVVMLTEVFNNPLMYMILFLSFYLKDSNDLFRLSEVGVNRVK